MFALECVSNKNIYGALTAKWKKRVILVFVLYGFEGIFWTIKIKLEYLSIPC